MHLTFQYTIYPLRSTAESFYQQQTFAAKVHNVTSRITSPAINYVPVSWTNLKANCGYFESKKKLCLDFSSTFKASNRF